MLSPQLRETLRAGLKELRATGVLAEKHAPKIIAAPRLNNSPITTPTKSLSTATVIPFNKAAAQSGRLASSKSSSSRPGNLVGKAVSSNLSKAEAKQAIINKAALPPKTKAAPVTAPSITAPATDGKAATATIVGTKAIDGKSAPVSSVVEGKSTPASVTAERKATNQTSSPATTKAADGKAHFSPVAVQDKRRHLIVEFRLHRQMQRR